MKKILLASTALIATAGMAAAEINFGGSARFGLVYNDATGAEELVVHNRLTINIDGTAETDSGLEFFGRVRIRSDNRGVAPTASGVSAARVGVRTGGFTLATGNINGAWESTPGLYDGSVGLTGLSWGNVLGNNSAAGAFSWDSFSSAGAGSNGIEVIYSAGDLGLHVSHSDSNDRTAAHISYSFGDWTVALAAQESETAGEDFVGLTVGGSIGAADLGLAIGDIDGDDAVRINGSFEVASGTTITAYATALDGAGINDAFGIGFTHSLGGATLAGGWSNTTADTNVADFGVRFNF
ncbi:MAG: porin [Aliishimia sp.]